MTFRSRLRGLFLYLIAAVSGFLLAYLVIFFFVFPSDVVPDDGTIPTVVGSSYDDAARLLETAGFESQQGESRYHSSAPKMTVLQQDPPAGTHATRGTKVILAVSAGHRSGEVPNVIGLTQQQAQAALENAGFDIGDVSFIASDASRGQVVTTRPPAETMTPIPATIDMIISSGPASVELPDLVGRDLPQARALIEQMGLKLGPIRRDTSSAHFQGTVLSQSPSAGRTVSTGSVVTLTVAGIAP